MPNAASSGLIALRIGATKAIKNAFQMSESVPVGLVT
jgi:hypothetical protein